MPVIIICAIFLFVFPASAQPTKAENALQCAVIYLISSSTADGDQKVIDTFNNIQIMFERIYLTIERKRLNRAISDNMLSKKKSELVSRLIWKYESDPQLVYAIEMQCNAWRKKIAPYVSKKIGISSNKTLIYSAFHSAPNMPDVPQASNSRWEKSKLMVDDSFAEWEKLGNKTRQAYRKRLKEQLDSGENQLSNSYASHQRSLTDISKYENTRILKKSLEPGIITLKCFYLHPCKNLDENMCRVLNSGPKIRTALGTFNTQANTIRWEEFYKSNEKSAFIKYWRIVVDNENVTGAIEIPPTRSGFNSFLFEKETMKVATNMLFFNNQNRKIEQNNDLQRFQCKRQIQN